MTRRRRVERPLSRALALVVFFGCVALLAWLERATWLPGAQAPADPAAVAYARCLAERQADVDRMRDEGLIDEARADLFAGRAAAMCRAGTSEGAPSSLSR